MNKITIEKLISKYPNYEIKPKSDMANTGYVVTNEVTKKFDYFYSLYEIESAIKAEIKSGKSYLLYE